jgi:hypothetical protein
VNETKQAAASVDRIEETFGQKPTKFLTDGAIIAGLSCRRWKSVALSFTHPLL